jgi:hypothetical protein
MYVAIVVDEDGRPTVNGIFETQLDALNELNASFEILWDGDSDKDPRDLEELNDRLGGSMKAFIVLTN